MAQNIRNVAIVYSEIRNSLYDDLSREFQIDLPRWKAQLIRSDLTIRFTEPEVLFASGSAEMPGMRSDVGESERAPGKKVSGRSRVI